MGNWTEAEVREMLRQFIGKEESSLLAEVTEVDEDQCTCNVNHDGADVYDVRLSPIIQAKSFIQIPKIGSHVLCVKIEGSEEWAMIGCSEIQKILINVGGKKLTVDENGFVFNDGSHGMVKASEVVGWMQKVYADLQTLQTLLSTSPVAGNGALLGIAFNPTADNPTPETIEDTTIKH